MSLRCDSLYTFPRADLVPRWRRTEPTGGSLCRVVPVGESRCRLVAPGGIGNVGYDPCGSVQDCNILS
jgi:hypothetical protein